MKTNTARRRRFLVQTMFASALTSIVGVPPSPNAYAAPTEAQSPSPAKKFGSLKALLAEFAKSPGMSAKFVEEKRIALLKTPLVNTGRLYFKRPGSFARHIDKPFPSSVLVTPKDVTLWDGAKKQVLALDQHPALATLTKTFLSILAGDLDVLQRAYKMRWLETNAGWTVTLEPKAPALKRLITRIELSGHDAQIQRLSLLEASGDRSETRFTEVTSPRTFSPADESRYFSLPRQ